MINLIHVQPHKGQNNLLPNISFTNDDALRHVPDDPLYIASHINNIPTKGILSDLACVENVITTEFLFVHELYQDSYDQLKAWINTHDGFSHPMIGSITLALKVGPKQLYVSFSVILMPNQFCVKLGYPWLCSMNFVPSIIHKCLKF